MKKQVLLISIIPRESSEAEMFQELSELKSLVTSYGGEVADVLLQRREIHDKGLYIGKGKIDEAADLIKRKHIQIVVLNGIIKPGHLFDLKAKFYPLNNKIEVWDKSDLILEIFALHAKTAEAKLQIELAAMRHMGPRIYGMGMVLSRQTGGIGGRGIGETNTELMRRHWQEQMKKTQDRLDKLALGRQRQLERRSKNGVLTASIIGYTNAGKTSLFNLLTGKKKYTRDELFATLDSTVGKVFLPDMRREILVSDTIGFLRHLPTQLIDAFKSTLLESIHADLLLHVIDASDPDYEAKIAVVETILEELAIRHTPRLYVFNKIDATDTATCEQLAERYEQFSPQFISVKQGEGVDKLLTAMEVLITQKQRGLVISKP